MALFGTRRRLVPRTGRRGLDSIFPQGWIRCSRTEVSDPSCENGMDLAFESDDASLCELGIASRRVRAARHELSRFDIRDPIAFGAVRLEACSTGTVSSKAGRLSSARRWEFFGDNRGAELDVPGPRVSATLSCDSWTIEP